MLEFAMISAFSSTVNATLLNHLLVDRMGKETTCSHYSMQTGRSKVLLDGHFCADLGHLVGDFLGFFLGDTFLHGLRGLINDSFGLFQSQASEFAYNFDDIDLIWSDFCEDGIELGLLFDNWGRCSLSNSHRSRASSCDRSCTHTPLVLQGFSQLNEF